MLYSLWNTVSYCFHSQILRIYLLLSLGTHQKSSSHPFCCITEYWCKFAPLWQRFLSINISAGVFRLLLTFSVFYSTHPYIITSSWKHHMYTVPSNLLHSLVIVLFNHIHPWIWAFQANFCSPFARQENGIVGRWRWCWYLLTMHPTFLVLRIR